MWIEPDGFCELQELYGIYAPICRLDGRDVRLRAAYGSGDLVLG